MDFDYTTETITPDTTNLLTVGGPGAFELPIGTTAQRPVAGLDNGAMRYNSDINNIESYINGSWVTTGGGGTVTSVAVSTSGIYSGSITVGSSPITSSGTITLTPNIFGTSSPGVVPQSGGGTSNFLRADGTWASPGGGVTSFSSGTTGFTPNTATTGAIVLSGTLNVANGGTGVTTAPTNGQLLIGNGAGYTVAGLTAGTAISITPAAGSITVTNTGVTSLAGTAGNITASAATGAVTVNLATVTDAGTGSFVKFTRDLFGRVSGTTAVTTSDITALVDSTFVDVTGDTMTGSLVMSGGTTQITLPNLPVAGTDAANKNYVDSIAAGLSWKQSVRAATTANGTLATAFANGQTIDGVTLVTGDRILIKDQTTVSQNGIYIVQASGAPVRSSDADVGSELVGASVFVDQGTANADSGWVQTTNAPITLGTSNIVWAQFSGSGTYTAGNGLSLTGNTFSLSTPVTAVNGGTGQSTYAVGDILQANSTTTLSRLPAVATGNALISGGASTVSSWGKIGLTTHVTGILPLANGGSNANLTAVAGGNVYSTATGFAITPAGTTGQYLQSNGAGVPTWVTLSSNAVTTFSGGTTGLTPNSATSGAITLAGTLGIANGGTGQTTKAAAYNALTPITATGDLTVGNGVNSATRLAIGTVGQILTVSGGTAVWAANAAILQLYKENPSTPTAPVATGTNAVAVGSGSSATAANTYALGAGSAANVANIHAFANGNFATAGDCQTIRVMARNITTNSTTTTLFVDGSAQRLVLPTNSAWTFTIRVTGRRTDAPGWAMYSFVGGITRDATAASTTLQRVSRTVLDESTGSMNCVVTGDATNGALQIDVTGVNGQTIRWAATVEITQVTN
jgi:hypothetical protein